MKRATPSPKRQRGVGRYVEGAGAIKPFWDAPPVACAPGSDQGSGQCSDQCAGPAPRRGTGAALVIGLALVALFAGSALAQTGGPYNLTWNTVDGGGNTSTGGTFVLTGTAGQPDAGDLIGGAFVLKGGYWQLCAEDCDCSDFDVCTADECLLGTCSYRPNRYGDVNGNGTISIFDLFCILDCVEGNFDNCCLEDCDIAPCEGNGTINIFDLFGVLNAFGGIDPCCDGLP